MSTIDLVSALADPLPILSSSSPLPPPGCWGAPGGRGGGGVGGLAGARDARRDSQPMESAPTDRPISDVEPRDREYST